MKKTSKNNHQKIISMILALIVLSCESLILGPEEKVPKPVVHKSEFATLLDSLRYVPELPALAAAIVTDKEYIFLQRPRIYNSRGYCRKTDKSFI